MAQVVSFHFLIAENPSHFLSTRWKTLEMQEFYNQVLSQSRSCMRPQFEQKYMNQAVINTDRFMIYLKDENKATWVLPSGNQLKTLVNETWEDVVQLKPIEHVHCIGTCGTATCVIPEINFSPLALWPSGSSAWCVECRRKIETLEDTYYCGPCGRGPFCTPEFKCPHGGFDQEVVNLMKSLSRNDKTGTSLSYPRGIRTLDVKPL